MDGEKEERWEKRGWGWQWKIDSGYFLIHSFDDVRGEWGFGFWYMLAY